MWRVMVLKYHRRRRKVGIRRLLHMGIDPQAHLQMKGAAGPASSRWTPGLDSALPTPAPLALDLRRPCKARSFAARR